MLTIKNLHVNTQHKEILKGVDLTIKAGEIHAIMGPNGAGKTTLAMAVAGHPSYSIMYHVSSIKYTMDGNNMLKLKPEERARQGLFVAFQQPTEVTGVSVLAFLRTAYKALRPKDNISLSDFKKLVVLALKEVHLDESFMQRYLNEGFSGGEKKRAEVAQLLVLRPKFAVLDEIDSGLDIDSLKVVANALKNIAKKPARNGTHSVAGGEKMGLLIITHYQRILHYLKPDMVHVLVDGKIVASDGMKLVTRIEKKGYSDLSSRT